MATGGSPNISQTMVPSSTSTLRRSNRSKSNISLIQKSKNYELNKQKAIDKKRNDCNSPHIRYEMKPRNNFCISFSTAAYELVKEFLHKYFDKQQCQEEYAIAVENGLDKSNAIVETRFKLYNKKRDGSIGNQHKYTVNCYNTTSRVLVNGVKTDKFVDNVLPIILELITSNESELDSVNNDIQRTLQPIEVNHWSNISQNKDIPYTTEQSSIEYNRISQTEDQQNVTIYFCPMCNERAGERTVGCEQCDEWIHFNCAGLKDSDIDKIKDNPFVCRLCIENNLYSTEIVHNKTSVNNAVINILHLDQQEPATELSKDKDQSTQPIEDETKIIQQNIQIGETNSSIVITEETQHKDQNMLTTSNSVQTLAQNKTAIELEQRPTVVKEKKTNNPNRLNQSKGQQRKSKDVEEFKKYIYELENRLKDRDQTINLLERKMALLEGNILIANQQIRNSEQTYHMFNQQPNSQANQSGCQSQCQYQHLSNNMRALEQQMSQHMCITTALTTQLAIQLQQSLSSTRNQIPPVNINMVPQPAPQDYSINIMFPQATNFAFHPSQGINNLNAAHYNQYIHQSTHGHPSRNHVRPTQASYQNQNRQSNGQIPPPPTYHQANLQRSSHYHQNRNNNQTMMTQHTNTNAKASSNILEKQQANTTHVLHANNSTKGVAQVPTIICSDGQNKMVHRNNIKTQHIPVRQPTTESKHPEVTITENFQVSASLVQSEVASMPDETIKESNQIVHQEENSIKQMTGNNQDAMDEGRQNQSNSFLEIPSLKNKPPDILRMGMATETLNSHGRD
ncbi:probable serine/threonine-protein kinase cdc7 [Mytilus edulis]|uniref:probable serine/threonine-protein kinase cdc7 n=1 Tax=Mytilus edulis TaxID=6550 RepID=UPI0039EDED9A